MHLNGCQYLFVRRNNILVDESCKLCFNRFIYNDRQIVILIFFWILKFALFSSNNFCFNDCILIFTMYYFSLNTLFVSRRGGGGWHTWTLIQILVKPPDLSPVRHCIFENNSCGVFFFLPWIFRNWLSNSFVFIHLAFSSHLIFVSALSHFTAN